MKYIYLAYTTLKKRTAYKFDIVMGYILVFIVAIASKSFWEALTRAGKIPVDRLGDFVTYSTITALMGLFLSSELINDMSEKIRYGHIVSDLQKPISFQALTISNGMGSMIGSFILDIVPKYIAMLLIIKIYVPHSWLNLVFFAISFLLGGFIVIAMDYIIGLFAFYFVEMLAFTIMKATLIGFCSGIYLPLWLLPKSVLNILNLLPFNLICFLPINIYLEKLSLKEVLTSLSIQVCWLLGLLLLGKIISQITLKKLTVAGG